MKYQVEEEVLVNTENFGRKKGIITSVDEKQKPLTVKIAYDSKIL